MMRLLPLILLLLCLFSLPARADEAPDPSEPPETVVAMDSAQTVQATGLKGPHVMHVEVPVPDPVPEIWAAGKDGRPTTLKGLVKVTRLKRPHWYSPHLRGPEQFHYIGEDKTVHVYGGRFKQLKDLRPYEEAHPVCFKIQEGCRRWGPVGSFVASWIVPAGIAAGAAMLP